jgi:hypothetical protein
MYEDKIVKTIKILDDTTACGNILANTNIIVNGVIKCDKLYSIEHDNIAYKYNLVPKNKLMLGVKTSPWDKIYSNTLDTIISKSYNNIISNSLQCGINNCQKPVLTVISTDRSSYVNNSTDFCLVSSIFKVGINKNNFYINPYTHASYINTDTLIIRNYTNGIENLSIDAYMNVSLNALNYKLSYNTLEYPVLTAINNTYNIQIATAVLDYDVNNIAPFYVLNISFERSTFGTFYNVKGVSIILKYNNINYTLTTKLEYYYNKQNNTFIFL